MDLPEDFFLIRAKREGEEQNGLQFLKSHLPVNHEPN